MGRYTVGVDCGTLSARAVVAEVGTGREMGACTVPYAHGVLETALPDGTPLPTDWALQVPRDYLDAFCGAVRGAVENAGVAPEAIIGIGLDVTSSTLLPLDEAYKPLCEHPDFASDPYTYIMLWKHHGGQPYVEHILHTIRERDEALLDRYGNGISAEWMLPKLYQIAEEAPAVYDAAARIMEVGDWLVTQLTGREARSEAMAGYKVFFDPEKGYPPEELFAAIHPKLRHLVRDKLDGPLYPLGTNAGGLTPAAAERLGLLPGTAVAVANVDAHVSLPGAGITEPGHLLMILGTSTCYIMNSEECRPVPGMSGAVKNGVTPGYYGYEAGQSCCGDHFRWMFQNGLPKEYLEEAQNRGLDLHALLSEKAGKLLPGESGLLALDWWNGNRSVLMDMDLTGLMLGLTTQTTPEEIYRAFIEATAFGMHRIIDAFEESSLPVKALYACGGIARKNPLFMQIYADVIGRPITVSRSDQTPALGSAMFGAVAAGRARGGYETIEQAAKEMGGLDTLTYTPDPGNHMIYQELYREYLALHDWFGRGGNRVMKRLKEMRRKQHAAHL